MRVTELTAAVVGSALNYDPTTGDFTWRRALSKRVKIGQKAGRLSGNGRIYISVFGEIHLAHRLAWLLSRNEWPVGNVSPKDGDYLNLRADNLVEESPETTVTKARGRSTNTSGLRGVSYDTSKGKWQATITHRYRQYHLGRFDTKEEAQAAYLAADKATISETGEEFAVRRKAHIAGRRWARNEWNRLVKDGIEMSWVSFADFVTDVGVPDSVDHAIAAVTASRSLGPDNFAWVVPEKPDFSTQEGRNAYLREYRSKNPDVCRSQSLRRDFGIDLPEYQRMFVAQNGVCAICSKPEKQKRLGKDLWLAIDHDHATGAIRALLCTGCNTGLGKFGDDPALLRAAADYLERHRAAAGSNVVQLRKDVT